MYYGASLRNVEEIDKLTSELENNAEFFEEYFECN